MEKIPSGWCATCNKQALDKIDLETEARDLVKKIKQTVPVAGALGGRDAALAEVCWLVELPVPPDMQRQELTEASAKVLLAEIGRRFGELIRRAAMNSERICREIYHEMKYREREERAYRERSRQTLSYRDFETIGGPVPFPTAGPSEPVEKHYYVPEYRVKENKRL